MKTYYYFVGNENSNNPLHSFGTVCAPDLLTALKQVARFDLVDYDNERFATVAGADRFFVVAVSTTALCDCLNESMECTDEPNVWTPAYIAALSAVAQNE
jgi:hypothetical protein